MSNVSPRRAFVVSAVHPFRHNLLYYQGFIVLAVSHIRGATRGTTFRLKPYHAVAFLVVGE